MVLQYISQDITNNNNLVYNVAVRETSVQQHEVLLVRHGDTILILFSRRLFSWIVFFSWIKKNNINPRSFEMIQLDTSRTLDLP